jgi:hypothetical protein
VCCRVGVLACWSRPRGREREREREREGEGTLVSAEFSRKNKEGGGGREMGEEVAVVRTTECMNGNIDVMSPSSTHADSVPDHLVVMVHGILGR